MLKNEHDQMDIPSMQKVFALISGITSNQLKEDEEDWSCFMRNHQRNEMDWSNSC